MSLIIACLCFELMPLQMVRMAHGDYAYNLSIPPVYTFIKSNPEIDRLIVLHADADYPNTPWKVIEPEEAMWAGYTNRRIFNGYSGYFPPGYARDLEFFNSLKPEIKPKLQQYDLHYALIDKRLSQSQPEFILKARSLWSQPIYQDDRYELFKL
jgi:hypothetical protein